MSANLAALLYLCAGILFILALRGLSSPATSRQGNRYGMMGMAIAGATTLLLHLPPAFGFVLIIIGAGVGGGGGAYLARRIEMTKMPELVAFFHSLVGLAAVLVAGSSFFAPQSRPKLLALARLDALKQAVCLKCLWAPQSARSHSRVQSLPF